MRNILHVGFLWSILVQRFDHVFLIALSEILFCYMTFQCFEFKKLYWRDIMG
jgi:hypothetical protein